MVTNHARILHSTGTHAPCSTPPDRQTTSRRGPGPRHSPHPAGRGRPPYTSRAGATFGLEPPQPHGSGRPPHRPMMTRTMDHKKLGPARARTTGRPAVRAQPANTQQTHATAQRTTRKDIPRGSRPKAACRRTGPEAQFGSTGLAPQTRPDRPRPLQLPRAYQPQNISAPWTVTSRTRF